MTRRRFRLIGAALLGAALIALAGPGPALAVDTVTTRDTPDLRPVRAKIRAKDWKGATADLYAMIDRGVQHADVYNLLGFSLRNGGDYQAAYTFYRKALEFNPEHKGALEYLGELYVKTGEMAKAREHVALLKKLCPQGCEELEDLEKAIAEAQPKTQ
jgi:tetratricopeptide (TPR) repeat protein